MVIHEEIQQDKGKEVFVQHYEPTGLSQWVFECIEDVLDPVSLEAYRKGQVNFRLDTQYLDNHCIRKEIV